MNSRMTKQLTIDALKDAVNNSGNVNGCVLHSDMGYMTPEEYYSKCA